MNGTVAPNVAVWFHRLLCPSCEDTLCLSLLLALRSRVEGLIYLSQGLRDHPAGLFHRIIPLYSVFFLWGKGKAPMLHAASHLSDSAGSVIPEEWSTKAFECLFLGSPTWPQKAFFSSCIIEDAHLAFKVLQRFVNGVVYRLDIEKKAATKFKSCFNLK